MSSRVQSGQLLANSVPLPLASIANHLASIYFSFLSMIFKWDKLKAEVLPMELFGNFEHLAMCHF